VLYHHTQTAPEPPSRRGTGLPKDLDAILLRCLEKDKAKRYASVGELAHALRALRAQLGASRAPAAAVPSH
jgi:serine/threonine-protein kinase